MLVVMNTSIRWGKSEVGGRNEDRFAARDKTQETTRNTKDYFAARNKNQEGMSEAVLKRSIT